MILIALGSNLPGRAGGTPVQNCLAALAALENAGIRVVRRSRFYRSPAWPDPDQPSFVNAVAALETRLDPAVLLAQLHDVERSLGRVRTGTPNAPRVIDLDLLDYDGRVSEAPPPVIPHPRLQDRAFVLRPLAEIAPDWRHPKSGRSIKDLLADLPKDAVAEPLEEPK